MRLIDPIRLKMEICMNNILERGKTLEEIIDDTPDDDAAPVVHGRWIANEFGYSCSICGCNSKLPLPYDAYCGAKMDLQEGDE